jgi:hypothetical protein
VVRPDTTDDREGHALWQYVLAENDWGISYDVHFHDTTRQVYREPAGSYNTAWPPGAGPT